MPLRDPADYIDHFVALVLSHLDREYPNKLDHVINDASELRSPRDLHPVFYGSFDWHSNVHGHWLLVRALRLFPALAQRADIIRTLDARFTDEAVAAETRYLSQPHRETFERTYGWAWLLKLAAEIKAGASASDPVSSSPAPTSLAADAPTLAAFQRWDKTLSPLASAFTARFLAFLPKATYPIRVGTHQNTAFGLALALDWARAAPNPALATLLDQTARRWYLKDQNYPCWEPDGIDFLSPGLVEAECMRRILPRADFLPWFDAFLPALAKGNPEPATLFQPAFVSDRTDGQITHLDGLNLSRAWCWRALATSLPESDPRRPLAHDAYQKHLDSALPHVTGDYMGEHWLATFALLAMTEP